MSLRQVVNNKWFFLLVFMAVLGMGSWTYQNSRHGQIFHSNDKALIRAILAEMEYSMNSKGGELQREQVSSVSKSPQDSRTGLIMFTTWKESEEKKLVHQNVINTWQYWRPLIKPLFFYSDKATGDKLKAEGWFTLPVSGTACGDSKVPIFRDMFLDAMEKHDSVLYGYANGDITFDKGISTAIDHIVKSDIVREKPVMVLVRRKNVDFSKGPLLDRSSNFTEIGAKGHPLTDGSSDGFFTNKLFPWKYVPDTVVGRVGIGMWMVSYARAMNATVIDITKTVRAFHMTTSSGNYESHFKPDKMCNHKLYDKYNAKPSSWGCGHITCSDLEVSVDKNGKVLMRGKPKRRYGKNCFDCKMDLTKLLPESYGKWAMTHIKH